MPPYLSLQPSAASRVWALCRFVLTALAASLAIHWGLSDPWIGGALLALTAIFGVPRLQARRRLERLLSSGDLTAILEAWDDALDELPHRRTVGPLVRATALAAHGLTGNARTAMARAERGVAWDGAIEHRLFVETLLDAFEGSRQGALVKAQALQSLPLPASPWAKSRAAVLRGAAGALARAFAHCPQRGDAARLKAAAKHHPLVCWAMRYALAIVHIDEGRQAEALRLLATAPEWPEDSAFRSFQQELVIAGGLPQVESSSP
jgi:hypothetical protein